MAILTRDLCNVFGNNPLSPKGVEICLSAIKVLVAALQGENNEEKGVAECDNDRKVVKKVAGSGQGRGRGRGGGTEDNDNDGDIGGSEEFGSGDSGVKNKRDKEGKGEETEDANEEDERHEEEDGQEIEQGSAREKLSAADKGEQSSKKDIRSTSQVKAISQSLINSKKETLLKLEDLIPIFIPDRTGVLSSSLFLTVDDAPWISSTISPRNSAVRFIHCLIDPLDAFLLGSKSLRGVFFSGDDMSCPKPKDLKSLLLHDQVNEVIRDFISLSDTLQATSISILYDMRTHPTESLMHPGLAKAQGPSLVIYLEGPSLTSDAICQLLGSTETLPSNAQEDKKSTRGYGFSGSNFDFNNGLNSVAGIGMGIGMGIGVNATGHDDTNLAEEERLYPVTGGKRLSTAFAITDCLQIMSGREYMIIDPCGLHLLSPDSQIDSGKKSSGDGKKNRDDGNGKAGGGKTDIDEINTLNVNGVNGDTDLHPVVFSSSRAQRCFLAGSHSSSARSRDDEDVLTRFPDQFTPMLSLPFDIDISLSSKGSLDGLLVRMVSTIPKNLESFYFYFARMILRLLIYLFSLYLLSFISSVLFSSFLFSSLLIFFSLLFFSRLFLSSHRLPFLHSIKLYSAIYSDSIIFYSIFFFSIYFSSTTSVFKSTAIHHCPNLSFS